MEQKERKYFVTPESILDGDDAAIAVPPNSWVNMENCRTLTTDNGITGVVESIGSTELKSVQQPSLTFRRIGSIEDEQNSRIFTLKKCTSGPWDKITCYFKDTDTELDVLLSSQVIGGLNFSLSSPIHSLCLFNNGQLLYWVDSTNNQPRKINVEAALLANNPSFDTDVVAYTLPIDPLEITMIKMPPQLAPNISKNVDGLFEGNFIYNQSFEFVFIQKWYDNETTVLGTYSPTSRLNKIGQIDNYIQVSMNPVQQIPMSVRWVYLAVRIGDGTAGGGNNVKIIKTWDKEIPADAAEIANQNSLTTPLAFNFYNNIAGEFISKNDVLKQSDVLPIFAGTLAAANNRIFMANTVQGYDTPLTSSLTFTPISQALTFGVLTKNLIGLSHRNGRGGGEAYGYSGWYVYLTEVVPNGWYALTSTEQLNTANGTIPTLPAPPAGVTFSGLTFRGADLTTVVLATAKPGTFRWDGPFLGYSANSLSISGLSVFTFDIFKSGCQYKGGIVFYDFAMRRCGVVTDDGMVFNIPNRTYSFSSGVGSVRWNLSNANRIAEIPIWAYYYCPVRTLNQRTRFFVQSFSNACKYAEKDADGEYIFNSTSFVTNCVGIAIDTTALFQSGLGYVFDGSTNDVVILTRSDDVQFSLPVIAQTGNYIIVAAQDVGTLLNTKFVYEVYTPYQNTTQEPFYETGNMYRILNPGTEDRQYETLSDIFNPDAYAITRSFSTETYFAEAMSPNDIFYKRWDNDGGKPNFISRIGQITKPNTIEWSNTFIPNTQINGLSTWDAALLLDNGAILGNEKQTPQNGGTIRKLILTSKAQDEGTVMLSNCTNETCSLYLGETRLMDNTGVTRAITSSNDVIGTINTLKGSYGTINPESVVEFRGNVYWYDALNGKYIQYSVNGLFPISNYKLTTFWKQFSQLYTSMTAAQIEAFGGSPFIFSTVDPHHNELLISIPKLSNTPPKGFLPDPEQIAPISKTCYDIRQNNFESVFPHTIHHYYGVYVYLTETFPPGYYVITSTEQYSTGIIFPVVPPANITFSNLSFRGSNLTQVSEYINSNTPNTSGGSPIISLNGSTTIVSGIIDYKPNPFDIWDAQGKTIVYKLETNGVNPHWQGSYSFNPEGFVTMNDDLYSYFEGHLYKHNSQSSYCNFYGTQYTSRIMFVSNAIPNRPKVYNNISIEANDGSLLPSRVYFYTTNPHQQVTDLVDYEFKNLEGVLYAKIKRNKIQPTFDGYNTSGLLTGSKMRSNTMFVMLEFSVTTTPLQLRFVSIGYDMSRGHTN